MGPTERSGSLSPIGGEGWGEGAGGTRLESALFSEPGNPLIPAFSPKGEKESEASVAQLPTGICSSTSVLPLSKSD